MTTTRSFVGHAINVGFQLRIEGYTRDVSADKTPLSAVLKSRAYDSHLLATLRAFKLFRHAIPGSDNDAGTPTSGKRREVLRHV